MLKAYKYRLYPDVDQKKKIDQTIDVCRFIYNLALETKISAWQSQRKNLSAFDLIYQLPELKQDHPWIKEVDSQAVNATINNMYRSFQHFFKGAGYPKFKRKANGGSFNCPNNTRKIDWGKSTLTIPKIKDIPIVLCRQFEGKIKIITVSRTPTGKYFAAVLVDNGAALPKKPAISPFTTIGIDVGIKSFAVTSNGLSFEPNRYLKNSLGRLQCLQRRASNKRKGSSNRRKANLCVAKLYEKVSNQRTGHIHQITTRLIRDNQTGSFVIENLNVSGMLKNKKLSQAITDVSFAEFFRQMKYKCDWYGKNLIVIDRFDPSSKRCSTCGNIHTGLTLSDREWICGACNAYHDRDLNAARNIKWFGLQQTIFNHKSPAGSRVEPVEPRRLRRAKKQEDI